MADDRTILIEDATILYRNFRGLPTRFNPNGGKMTFNVFLDEEIVPDLIRDGWNVKRLTVREDDDPDILPQAHMEVIVKFDGFKPPRIVVNTSNNRVEMDENTVGTLDFVDIERVDMIINPHDWDINQKTGIKGYLKTMFIWINEDYLEKKYASLEDLPARAGRIEDDA
jgi:hypothetical protein